MAQLPPLRLTGATILRDGALQRRSLAVAEGRITRGPLPEIDVTGYLVLPGIVDLGAGWAARHVAGPNGIGRGLTAAAEEAARHGVTTLWLSQGWSWEGGPDAPTAAEQVLMEHEAARADLGVDLHIQLRCETHMMDSRDRLIEAVARHGVQSVTFHNRLPAALVMAQDGPEALAGKAALAGMDTGAFVAQIKALRDRARDVPRHLCLLAEAFDRLGVTYGSHADPDGETREQMRIIGARLAECPASPAAAAVAKAMGDPVLLSAPAARRGEARLREMLGRGQCDALISADQPAAPAAAAFALADAGILNLAEAWALVSSGPSDIMGLHDRGRLAPGKRADFIVVNETTREVEATVSSGRLVHLSGTLYQRLAGSRGFAGIAAE